MSEDRPGLEGGEARGELEAQGDGLNAAASSVARTSGRAAVQTGKAAGKAAAKTGKAAGSAAVSALTKGKIGGGSKIGAAAPSAGSTGGVGALLGGKSPLAGPAEAVPGLAGAPGAASLAAAGLPGVPGAAGGLAAANAPGSAGDAASKSAKAADNAALATGLAKVGVNAVAGNATGAVIEGVKTVTTTKSGKKIAIVVALALSLSIAAQLAIPMLMVLMLGGQLSGLNQSSQEAAVSHGVEQSVQSTIQAAAVGSSVPWELLAAIYSVQSPKEAEGHLTGYAIEKYALAPTDPEDLTAVTRWMINRLSGTAKGSGDTEAADIHAGMRAVTDDESDAVTHLGVNAEDSTDAAAAARARDIWVPGLALLPIADAGDANATEIYDLALQIAGGVSATESDACVVAVAAPAPTDPAGAATAEPVATTTDPAATAAPDPATPTDATVAVPVLDGYSEAQMRNASTIVAVGATVGATENDLIVALMVALTESGLKNYANSGENRLGYQGFGHPGTAHWLGVARLSLGFPHEAVGNDADSVGVFQQRASAGWGGPTSDPGLTLITNLMSVEWQARAFFGGPEKIIANRGLLEVAGREAMALGKQAQTVQVSAFPDAYNKHEPAARAILAAVGGGAIYGGSGNTCVTGGTGSYDGVAVNGGKSVAGMWGGYPNGKIPMGSLTALSWAPTHWMRPDAAAAAEELRLAYSAAMGHELAINSSYRDLATQISIKASLGSIAAPPGTSNHGWGLALDLDFIPGTETHTSAEYLWMAENAPSFGFINPDWAVAGGWLPEPWHWEYQGVWTQS